MDTHRPSQSWGIVALALAAPFLAMLRLQRPLRAAAYLVATCLAFASGYAATASGAWPGPSWSFPVLAVVHFVAAYDAFRMAAKGDHAARRRWYSRWPVLAGIALIVWLVVPQIADRTAKPFNIASASMAPTLIQGDRVLVKPLSAPEKAALRRGDIVVFSLPGDPDQVYVKRIIGLPGDRIRVEAQTLELNGEIVRQEPVGGSASPTQTMRWLNVPRYIEHRDTGQHEIMIADPDDGPSGEWRIAPNHYFLMGDNRNFSNDSRFLGPIDGQNIIGQPFIIWWSAVSYGGAHTRWTRIGKAIH